jgi:hypothetical protein
MGSPVRPGPASPAYARGSAEISPSTLQFFLESGRGDPLVLKPNAEIHRFHLHKKKVVAPADRPCKAFGSRDKQRTDIS